MRDQRNVVRVHFPHAFIVLNRSSVGNSMLSFIVHSLKLCLSQLSSATHSNQIPFRFTSSFIAILSRDSPETPKCLVSVTLCHGVPLPP